MSRVRARQAPVLESASPRHRPIPEEHAADSLHSMTPWPLVVPYNWHMVSPRENVMAERMRLALELYEAGEAMMRQRIRRQCPTADSATVERMLVEWLRTRPGAEHGDGAGRPASWPRTRS